MESKTAILTKAIRKAVDGGYRPAFHVGSGFNPSSSDPLIDSLAHASNIYQILFSHDFAKAIWGEEWPRLVIEQATATINKEDTYKLGAMRPYWQEMLMQMVISDDPIKYLGEHLDG